MREAERHRSPAFRGKISSKLQRPAEEPLCYLGPRVQRGGEKVIVQNHEKVLSRADGPECHAQAPCQPALVKKGNACGRLSVWSCESSGPMTFNYGVIECDSLITEGAERVGLISTPPKLHGLLNMGFANRFLE